MTLRHRRRSIRAEVIAPWVALSVVLFVWFVAAQAMNWVRPGHRNPLLSFGRVESSVPKAKPVDNIPRGAVIAPDVAAPGEATISANTVIRGSDLESLRARALAIPVRGLDSGDLVSSFYDARGGGRRHQAIDLLAPRGTDVLAVEDGKIARLLTSAAGGLSLYQLDGAETFVYYYAHLDSYAPGLKEGARVRKGEVLGAVGTTGNAPKGTPHLHFAISKLDPDKRWWGGTALDPFLVWRDPSES